MVHLSPVQAIFHEAAREAEAFEYCKRLFVNVHSREVLRNGTVVVVAELSFIALVVEQVVHVYVVYARVRWPALSCRLNALHQRGLFYG